MTDTLDVERLRAVIGTLFQSWDRWQRDCDDNAYHKFQHAMSDARDAFSALLDAAEERDTLKRERDLALDECRTRGIELEHARNAGPPGLWVCPRCAFVCARSNLNARDGSITANLDEPEPCPNDGEMLRRVTWREQAIEMAARAEEQMGMARVATEERDEARAQLDAVERACSLVLLGSLPGHHGDRSIQLFHWKALGDAIRTAPKAPTTTPTEEPRG